MSSTYNGKSGNVAPPTALTITAVSAGATPTVTVSGSLPAAFLTGVVVDITGVQGATGVNGQNVATVTGASTFTVPVGAPGTYTSGGSVQPIYLQALTVPSDGDVRSAASVNVPIESEADQIAFLTVGTGTFKIASYFFFSSVVGGNFSTTGSSGAGVVGTVWADWTGTIAGLMPFAAGDGATIPVNAGDIVELTVSGTLRGTGVTSDRVLTGIWYANYVPGASPSFIESNAPHPTLFVGASAPASTAFTTKAIIVVINTGLFDFKIRYMVNSATTAGGDFLLEGGIYASAMVLRGTGVPQ